MYLIMSNGHSATRWIANRLRKDNLSHCYHSYDLINTNPSLKDIVTYHHFLKNNINEFVNTNSQQNMNRFKTKSQTSEVIDGEYEIIKDSENNKN